MLFLLGLVLGVSGVAAYDWRAALIVVGAVMVLTAVTAARRT